MIDIGESTNSVGNTMSQSLLSAEMGMDGDNDNPSTLHAIGGAGSEYNMKEYFITFVMDMYNLFQTLPIPIQALLLMLMLYLAWKLF